ncbi:MAG: helix-turn-helix domain-containing protein [Prevotella sp.]|nr:helix-turn-helix domain-containing protein [Prevotella sp.]
MIYEEELYGKSNSELIMELGNRFKEYRLACRMTQKEVSEKAGISLFTVKTFESGRAYNITMGSFIAMLRAISFLEEIEKLLPELPPTPEMIELMNKNKPKRIRNGK